MAQKSPVSERQFRKRVSLFLPTLKNTAYFPIQQEAIIGDPDFMLCINGKFVALELKTDKGTFGPGQEYKLAKIERCGGISIVARPQNWQDVKKLLQQLSGGVHAKTDV